LRLASFLTILLSFSLFSAKAESLTTTFASGNGQNGNMFNLVNLTGSNISISNLWGVHVDDTGTTVQMELYYVDGGFAGHEHTASDWTFVGTGSGLGAGSGIATSINFSSGFTLPALATYGIYITRTDGLDVNYTDGTQTYSDGTLQFVSGTGNQYAFASVFSPRIWNGTVNYDAAVVPEPGTVALMLGGLGALAVLRPRKRT
jgi:hypothetical protein